MSYNHVLAENRDVCTKCCLTREKIEDGYHCGRIICIECTLFRICAGSPPTCDECRTNQLKATTSGYVRDTGKLYK